MRRYASTTARLCSDASPGPGSPVTRTVSGTAGVQQQASTSTASSQGTTATDAGATTSSSSSAPAVYLAADVWVCEENVSTMLKLYSRRNGAGGGLTVQAGGASPQVSPRETMAATLVLPSPIVSPRAAGAPGSPAGSAAATLDARAIAAARKFQVGERVVVVGCKSDANGSRGVVHDQAGELVWVNFGEPRGIVLLRAANVRDDFSIEFQDPKSGVVYVFTIGHDKNTVLLETPHDDGAVAVATANRLVGLDGSETVHSLIVNRGGGGGGGGDAETDATLAWSVGRTVSSAVHGGTTTITSPASLPSPPCVAGGAPVLLTLPRVEAPYLLHRLARLFTTHGVMHDLPSQDASSFPKGVDVRAHGLLNLPSLNGKIGKVVDLRVEDGLLTAVQVDFDGDTGRMFVRPENLTPVECVVPPPAAAGARASPRMITRTAAQGASPKAIVAAAAQAQQKKNVDRAARDARPVVEARQGGGAMIKL